MAGKSGVNGRQGRRIEHKNKVGACEREGAQPLLGMDSSEESSFPSDEEEGLGNMEDLQMHDSLELGNRKVSSEILRLNS